MVALSETACVFRAEKPLKMPNAIQLPLLDLDENQGQACHLGDGDGSSRKGLLVYGIGILDVQTRGAQGVSGHPSLASEPPTIESPILAPACEIVASALSMQESSCAPNACFRKSRSLAVSREIIHGITVEQPSGIGGTAFGCGIIFMLLL